MRTTAQQQWWPWKMAFCSVLVRVLLFFPPTEIYLDRFLCSNFIYYQEYTRRWIISVGLCCLLNKQANCILISKAERELRRKSGLQRGLLYYLLAGNPVPTTVFFTDT